MSPFHELARSVADLLRSWWRVDRIRASPCEGRLLRLHPPCFIAIDGQTVEIARRVIGQDADGPFVIYDCRAMTGPAKLLVRLLTEPSQTLIRWIGPDGERPLNEHEVSVFESKGSMPVRD